MRGLNWFDNSLQDFRYAIRQLRKSPGFACTATLVMSLGISAAVAIFGLVEAALIKPLPYRDQSRLVAAYGCGPNARCSLSYLNFLDWKRLNKVFRSIDAYALNGGLHAQQRCWGGARNGHARERRVLSDLRRRSGARP
jgi:hypothetical protein